MAFTGKATYSAGAELPEIAEDVSEVVSLASPHDTPLLDALGDAARPARSTVHEWLEDTLVPNTVTVLEVDANVTLELDHIDRVRVGDVLARGSGLEVVRVTAVDTFQSQVTVERGHGSDQEPLAAGETLTVLGHPELEGADAGVARFTTRTRLSNHTQIFSRTIEVSGSELAVRQIGVRDELEYAKAQRLREAMRDLENTVINGVGSDGPGDSVTPRSMKGLLRFLAADAVRPGVAGFPDDGGAGLTEEQLNLALRRVWERAASNVDLIVVGGREKRAINRFVASDRRFTGTSATFKDRVSVYESDFGSCRVVLSRHVPAGTVMLLDSSRIGVVPLAGRSFQYKPLARTGDRESGQVVGEYTLELRNPEAHGLIAGLA